MRLKVSEATTPLPIMFSVIPLSTQLYATGFVWAQVTVMPAAAGPAAAGR